MAGRRYRPGLRAHVDRAPGGGWLAQCVRRDGVVLHEHGPIKRERTAERTARRLVAEETQRRAQLPLFPGVAA